MIKALIPVFALLLLLLPFSFSSPPRSSFHFQNVYMKSYDITTPNSTHSYLWGASGQIVFFLDKRTFPVEQILIKIRQDNSSALSKVSSPSFIFFFLINSSQTLLPYFTFPPSLFLPSSFLLHILKITLGRLGSLIKLRTNNKKWRKWISLFNKPISNCSFWIRPKGMRTLQWWRIHFRHRYPHLQKR